MGGVNGRRPTMEALDSGWGVRSFDPWDPRITNSNIWGIYRQMRAAGPAVRSDAQGGFWSITRYVHVRDAAADFKTFSSAGVGSIIGREHHVAAIPLELDRPEHTRYRKAMQAPFLTHRVGQFTGVVRSTVRRVLDGLTGRETFDIVHDVAEPIPLAVISDILGIPAGERQEQHRRLALGYVYADLSTLEQAYEDYSGFFREEVDHRLAHPGDDLISELCGLRIDGQPFTPEEIGRMARALALAGHHTTINGISSLLMRMGQSGLMSRYVQQADLGPAAIEETLRLDSPIHLEARTTTAPALVGDVEIPAGARVALLYASANHDDDKYPDPESFVPGRPGPAHLSFGHGVHKCLGAHLSRLEMSLVLEEMARSFPDYRLTADPVGSGMVFGHHMGWESMPAATR
ncbi:MAG: cytochrome P450 [Actinobacteria bacterium]|nr:cytochrome P450 [Actinomycetota bacterium]